ncbi:hypothetical protein V8E54_009518 [Elaphomyces granulatus]
MDSAIPVVISHDSSPVSVGDEEDLPAVLLLGLTGSGKSTFISLLAEQNVVVGHNLTSGTAEIRSYNTSVLGRKVILIDTPGFDDTNKSDFEILSDISLFLGTLHRTPMRLVGIIYLQRITDIRMSGSSLKSIGMTERLCGLEACPGITIATTMWASLQMAEGGIEEGTARERQLSTFFGTLVKNGAKFKRHFGTKESAESIMSELVRENATIVLDIQKQLVDDGLILGETPVGRYVQQDMLKQHQKYLKELQELEKALQEAQQNKDESTLSQLKEEHDQQRNLIQRLEVGRQGLNLKLDQLAERKNPEYASLLESDRSIEEESKLPSLRAQISKLKMEMQKHDKQVDELRLRQHDEQSRAISERKFQQARFEIQQYEKAVRMAEARRARRSLQQLNFDVFRFIRC